MPTLGDLNPNLYKKSQLQLDNEARVGSAASAVTNSSNNPTLNNTPGSQNVGNPTGIIESNAGYTNMSGQRTASNSQLEATRQNMGLNAPEMPGVGKATEQPTYFNRLSQDSANQFEQRPQDKAPDQNQGLYYNNSTGQTNNPGYKPQSTTGNAINNFTNNQQAIDQNKVTANLYKKLQEFSAGQQAATARGDSPAAQMFASQIASLRSQIGDTEYASRIDPNTGQYLGSTATPGSTEADVYAANKKESEMTSTYNQATSGTNGTTTPQDGGISTNTGTNTTGGSTGVAQFDNQIGVAGQIASDQMQYAQDTKRAQDNAVKQKMVGMIMQSSVADLGYTPDQLMNLSIEELQSLSNTAGFGVAKKIQDQLVANDQIRIKNEELAKADELANNKMVQGQLERNLGRAVSERESFNIQQDTKLRRMMGAFGGGNWESLTGNMAVMDAADKGQKALADLRIDYSDRMDSNGRQYNTISQTHTNNINMIQNDMASKIEGARSALLAKRDELIDLGVTNQKELNTAMMGAKKEYLNTYVDATNKAAEWTRDANQQTFENLIKLEERQQAQDKSLMETTGFMYKNGVPVLGEDGMRIETLDMMKFNNDTDKLLSEQEGIVYRDGKPLLDSKGNAIPTFDRVKEANAQARWEIGEENANNRFYTGENNENTRFNLGQQNENDRFNITNNLAQDKYTAELFEKGITQGRIDQQTGMIRGTSGIFSSNGSKYTPFVEGDAIRANVEQDAAGKLKAWNSVREQCGEFVNDFLGKKVMGDSFLGKLAKAPNKVAQIGSAFVQATSNQYGHTGIVEKVGYNERGIPTSMEIIDSNAKGNGKIERATVAINYDQNGNATYTRNGRKVDIRGFTDSVLGKTSSTPTQQMTMSPSGKVLMKDVGGITGQSPLVGIPKQAETRVNQLLGAFDNEPQVRSFQIMQNAIDSVRNLDINTTNPSDDQSLIYAFAKVMDPTSSVKEGEYTTIKDYSQKLFDKYGSGLGQAWSGTGFLSPTARANIKKTLDGKFSTEKKAYDNVRNQSMKKIDAAAGKQGVGEQLLQDYSYSNNQPPALDTFSQDDKRDAWDYLKQNGETPTEQTVLQLLLNAQ